MEPIATAPELIKESRLQRSRNAVSSQSKLKKAVDALAIVPSNQRITLLARKVYNVLLFYAQKQGIEQPIYRASLREITRGIDFNSNNTEVLKEHLRQMVTTKVEWQSPTTNEGQRWSVSAMISHADIISEKGEVVIEWSYAPNIRGELLDPQRFALLSIQFLSTLRSYASISLYEICCRYINNPSGLTARQSWEWWHPVLTGSPANDSSTLREYKYFKRDVLRNAIAEINCLTDVTVELIEHKVGRTISEIQFRVGRNVQPNLPLSVPPEPVDLRHIGKAISLGIPQEKAERLLSKFGADALSDGLEILQGRVANTRLPTVSEPTRFLSALLASRETPAAKIPTRSTTKSSSQAQTVKASKIALIERFRSNKRTEISMYYTELSKSDQIASVQDFEREILPTLHPVIVRAFKREGITPTLVKPLFLKFLADKLWGGDWDQPADSELLELATE
jgi:Initiator Replication protein